MCRLVGYLGKDALLISDLIEKPQNSLIKQSKHATEDSYSVNADGFGFAWYDLTLTPEAGIFKSIQPAWNDNNLQHLSKMIRTHCCLAHIRASNVGDVSFNNCHPFGYDNMSFAHNGIIHGFNHIKRALLNKLDDTLFCAIKGQTDSEHIFYLILHYLKQYNVLEKAILSTIQTIMDLQQDHPSTHYIKFNTIFTDGNTLIATRFTSKDKKNLSMYYYLDHNNVIIASEKLTGVGYTWKAVPSNHILIYSKKTHNLTIKRIG